MTQVTNTVRLVLDGQIVEARGLRRTTTVLDFLREHQHRTGTKEGCAEGDCGACVVLVGELDAAGEGVDYRPVNACMQLLPTLDGKSLKTVESLRRPDGSLHPVQDAMVGCHGSQCGFCTPGIVMALTGLMQVLPQPSRAQVNDALQGNLCRCTGYRPIVDAALQASAAGADALKLDDAADVPLLREIQRPSTSTYSLDGDLVVQPVVRTRKGSSFVSPCNLAELQQALAEHPEATLVAGSTEIGLKVNKQFLRPEHLIYLGQVAELKTVQTSASAWRIGAAVPLEDVMRWVASEWPAFAEVLRRFGSPPVRATATLAGNIANGSPIGDSMPVLMALDASLVLRQGAKTRTVPLDAFYTGMKQNVLQTGEFIEAVNLPRPAAGQQLRAHKVSKRFDQDISALCAAMRYQVQDGRLRGVRLAVNGVTPWPQRVPALEALLEGREAASLTAAEVDAVVASVFPARDGLRGSWAYRSLVARNLVLRFIDREEAALA
ncbi:xanthine dehydrogenase small subunit [Ideonella livida]|uniref:Xanthine dehydrogenase small subunit n=1 Tax=Ideonella livida TaxID=2707176 RepID=A0A7C9TGF3_9BURK|nr:xanthine dehydrogenase small subunit [Ideonella livida]NDY89618.1 xanthine dehydrogenase small subunit [Ideonella livida]